MKHRQAIRSGRKRSETSERVAAVGVEAASRHAAYTVWGRPSPWPVGKCTLAVQMSSMARLVQLGAGRRASGELRRGRWDHLAGRKREPARRRRAQSALPSIHALQSSPSTTRVERPRHARGRAGVPGWAPASGSTQGVGASRTRAEGQTGRLPSCWCSVQLAKRFERV